MRTTRNRQVLLYALIFITLFFSSAVADILKYPFNANFDVRTMRYTRYDLPCFSMNIFNNDFKAYDSLEVRIYFRAQEGFETDLGARLDIFVLYRQDGMQEEVDSIRNALWTSLYKQKPVRIEETYDTATQSYAYYLALPLSDIALLSQARVRYDISFCKREPELQNDLLEQPPEHVISDSDWTFGPHATSSGDLIDFPGVSLLARDAIDTIKTQPVNYYLTIHRGSELLWGIPPDWETFYDRETFIPVDTRPRQDPMPYALIAVPFNEFEEPLIRDSANLKISPLRVNQAGYRPGDRHYFYRVGSSETAFSVIDIADNTTVASGSLKNTGSTGAGQLRIKASNDALLVSGGDTRYLLEGEECSGTVYEGEIPDLPEGRYRIAAGADTSAPFVIRHDVYNMVKDALLKFYGVNRCGDSKSWFHPPCHLSDPVTGGWHDCGDHLKEGATQSYTAAVLGLAAAVFSDVDEDLYAADQSKTLSTDGIPDILYEAKHGADFILRSYDIAGGDVSTMITSVGGFGNPGCGDDHMWWGPPELQDLMPPERGGPPRCARSEPTTDYLGKYAANLAFVSKCMTPYDPSYADRCIEAAKAIYNFTKNKIDHTNTSAYNGATIVSDDAAFGCLALLWATGERTYLDELCFDSTIGTQASPNRRGLFTGGWFTNNDPLFTKSTANTGWALTHTHVLWGFFRLILNDTAICRKIGLTEEQRLTLIENTVINILANLSAVGKGTESIPLPEGVPWVPSAAKYDLPWFTMQTQMEWVWNRYQAGNCTDLFYYYDIARNIEGIALPTTPATTDWKTEEVQTLLVRMMDYMLGVNPWDISMIYGIGYKNFNHPHHRASNPELRSCFTDYPYRHLVGALQGGYMPSTPLYEEAAIEYFHSEVGIEGTTNILMPVLGLSVADRTVSAHTPDLKASPSAATIQIFRKNSRNSILIRSSKPLLAVSLFTLSGRVIERVHAGPSTTNHLELQSRTGNGTYLVRIKVADGSTITRRVSQVN